MSENRDNDSGSNRRDFVKGAAVTAGAAMAGGGTAYVVVEV